MDTKNWKPTAAAPEPAMEDSNWRSQLQSDSRQTNVNQLMEILKKLLSFSCPEELQLLEKVAMRFEENIYAEATSQSHYLKTISLKMLMLETKCQYPVATISSGNLLQQIVAQQSDLSGTHQLDMQQSMQAQGQTAHSILQQENVIGQLKQVCQSEQPLSDTSSTSLDLLVKTGHANGDDWREEVYQRIKTMKDTYLPELTEMYQKIATKLQQHESLPQQPKSDQLDKLKIFKKMLERMVSFLQVSKINILPGYKEKLGLYEKQIIHLLTATARPKKPTVPLQQGQVQSHENPMQMQSVNMQGSVPSMQQNNMSSMAPDRPWVSAKQQKEQLVQQVKKQKVELQNLKQTLVELQFQQQQVKEEKE